MSMRSEHEDRYISNEKCDTKHCASICKISLKTSSSSVYSSMPLRTRNIAKGVPPRVHLLKSTKPKPSAGKKDGATKAAPTRKDRKRHASTSGDESEEQSEDLEPKARKKRARQEATRSEEEVEEVNDDPVPKPSMERVSDVDDEQSEQPDEDEVSTDDYISQRMDQLTR